MTCVGSWVLRSLQRAVNFALALAVDSSDTRHSYRCTIAHSAQSFVCQSG